MEKLIITVAPTGSVPRKDNTPHVPVTTDEIVEDALRCEDRGASIFHIHVRDEEQRPSDDPERFAEVVERLEGRTGMILQISTGGRAGVDLDSRIKRLKAQTEMASLTTGSVNFPNSAYINPPDLVEGLAAEMKRLGIKPEMEIFDLSMINNALRLEKKGLAASPLHFNFVLGLRGAIPATIENLVYMRGLIPKESTWTASGIASAQLTMGVHAILMGGHVRVGLEDNIYFHKGQLATNEMLIGRMADLARQLGREVATPDEARKILSLKQVSG
ncbi:MAG: 3-keto-5-aminohexanoate cleavage protein [Proteobacteria bacterium]|nr:3-keto-5-aminohexanoate cleavage protein [Pseudomonadota bacterium]